MFTHMKNEPEYPADNEQEHHDKCFQALSPSNTSSCSHFLGPGFHQGTVRRQRQRRREEEACRSAGTQAIPSKVSSTRRVFPRCRPVQVQSPAFTSEKGFPAKSSPAGGEVGDCASRLEDSGAGTRNQGDTQRLSWPHFLRSSRGRTIMGAAVLSSGTSRTSQATSGSAYSQPDDPTSVVGVAL